MNYAEKRKPYEFDSATKREALLSTPNCEYCGLPESPDDRFECNHAVAIWFTLENPCLAAEAIKSLANLQIVHHSCHKEIHKHESRQYYQELAPIVLSRYLSQIIDHSKDDWRVKLQYYKGRGTYGHD